MMDKKSYTCFASSENDIETVYKHFCTLVTDNPLPYEWFLNLWKKNNQTVTLLYRDSTMSELMGHYILQPITQEAVNKLMTAELTIPRELGDEYTAPCFNECSGIYLRMVNGTSQHASVKVIAAMIEQLSPLLSLPRITGMFTRGVTDAGRAAMKRFGFEQIKNSPLFVLYFTEDKFSDHDIRKILYYR